MLHKIKQKISKKKKPDAIDSFQNYEFEGEAITVEQLKKIPIGEVFDIIEEEKGAIVCERIDADGLVFKVTQKKGYKWKLYKRPDVKDICVLIKGKIEDLVLGVMPDKAESLVLQSEQYHEVYSHDDSLFYVDFTEVDKIENN